MPRKSIDLLTATDPAWVEVILDDFDAFLADHANCERKASALAMSLVVKYPDRTAIIPALIDLALEELEHFRQVYALMARRGLRLQKDTQDPYVNQLLALMRHGREERFIDRLLISSVIECRGAERFRLIAAALEDPQLRRFYRDLAGAEARHGHQFAALLGELFPEERIYPRLRELMEREAQIISALPWRPSLH